MPAWVMAMQELYSGSGGKALALPDRLAALFVEGHDAVVAAGLEDGQGTGDQNRFGVAPAAAVPAEFLRRRAPACAAGPRVEAAQQAVAGQQVEIPAVDRRRCAGTWPIAFAGRGRIDFPLQLPVEVVGEEHQLVVDIPGDVHGAAGHGDTGVPLADVGRLPQQRRTVFRPFLQQSRVGRLAVAIRAAEGGPLGGRRRAAGVPEPAVCWATHARSAALSFSRATADRGAVRLLQPDAAVLEFDERRLHAVLAGGVAPRPHVWGSRPRRCAQKENTDQRIIMGNAELLQHLRVLSS